MTHPDLAQRRQLRLVVAGSVDDGKSTLVGRLLHDTKSILADQYDAIATASRRRGAHELDLALLTDGLRAEREQGITIDVAYRYFSTPRRSFILADTPGHTQYTRNTVTGASTADAALILVDVRNGVTVQTRRHAAVMALLKVPHVVVAVNKMDAVGWDRAAFEEVAAQVARLGEQLGLADLRVVPISALTGENVAGVDATGLPGAPRWHTGPTLLEVLEELDDHLVAQGLPLRFPVQLVIRPRTAAHPDYRGLAGRVASGVVAVGDAVTALPSGLSSTVAAIDTPRGPAPAAGAGESVTVLLADELDIGRGQVLCRPGQALPSVLTELDGVVCWLDERPSTPGQRLLVKAGSAVVRGLLTQVGEHWHVEDQRWGEAGQPASLNDIARVRVRLAEPVAVDQYAEDRATGAFLLIDPAGGATLAAGMVGDPLTAQPPR
jgi:sulfate adenylyltransferase subunit 1